jgi:ABC-type bacteriocin/lantibiotic exporter with double-glycine peptidase domain
MLGFLEPASGEILINGIPAGKEQLQNCWSFIAYIKQQPFFIHDSLLRNITLEETDHNKENLQSALEISGLNKFMTTSANGLEMIITENGKNISGGQRQRIAIARAIYKNADLVLLDEPFSELDEESESSLLRSLQQMSQQGRTIILVTHNKKSLSFCNKIISLDEE